MPRPREFDEDAALDAAIGCFWQRGLETTTVRDLADAMGLSQPSLYNAFGDKRALFVRALQRYAERSMRERIGRLEARCAPAEALGAFFREIIERSLADRGRRGCLIVNSALEVAPHDAALRREIAAYLGEIEAFFRRCLARGQAAGEIASTIDPIDTARLLLGLLMGLRVASRVRPERALLDGMARPALALLEP